jgi:hypothetical protein
VCHSCIVEDPDYFGKGGPRFVGGVDERFLRVLFDERKVCVREE